MNPLNNIRFEESYFRRSIWKNPLKAESHRFGNENSEDALTWNVFATLARQQRLSAFLRSFFEVSTNEEPELYLWGLRVCLDGPASEEQFPALCNAREVFGKDIRKFHTEPDIMLYVPGKFLLLIEAKFTSANTTIKRSAKDVSGRKPETREGLLKRYHTDDLLVPSEGTPFFSQLYRNLVFGAYMANQLDVTWGFVNLTTKQTYDKGSADWVAFADAILPTESRNRFVRYT
jgi:hypothetical protein